MVCSACPSLSFVDTASLRHTAIVSLLTDLLGLARIACKLIKLLLLLNIYDGALLRMCSALAEILEAQHTLRPICRPYVDITSIVRSCSGTLCERLHTPRDSNKFMDSPRKQETDLSAAAKQ